jgi:predicted SAM-dependent methyltransferase
VTVATKPLRLDIGSSHLRVNDEYTTVDLYAEEADVKADMGALPYGTGTVDEIFASHVLEHISRDRVAEVLREWFRVLVPGRPALIIVPSLDYAARYWLHGPNREKALGMLFGHQEEVGQTHLTGWNPAMLRDDLTKAGFTIVSLGIVFEDADHSEGSYWHDMESLRAEVVKPQAKVN